VPGPLDGLKKATSIGPVPNPAGHPEDDWLGTGVQGLLGTVGLGDDTSQANRGGQVLSAAIPLLAPHPAITALLKVLGGAPEALDANQLVSGEKVGGWIPHRSAVVPPEGFSFQGTSPFGGRNPALVDKYVQEQNRFNMNTPTAPKPVQRNRVNEVPSGFDSKFSFAGSADPQEIKSLGFGPKKPRGSQ
jgi:hypothetical protein